MNIRRIILLGMISLSLFAIGQDYVVESFENIAKDLTAKTNPRIDNNGRKCGLIKVYVKDAITATKGPVIGDIVDLGMEKWVYVSHDAKQIQLLFKEHMPLYVTFEDFDYPTITGQMTYILKLKEDVTSLTNLTITSSNEVHTLPHSTTAAPSEITILQASELSDATLDSEIPHAQLDTVIQNLINNMVFVEGGTFMMGSDDKDASNIEKPVHKVSVESFSIGKYEVTQKEWKAVMGNNPSKFKGEDHPVENVSWNDCQEFISKLNSLTGLKFRLPTEEEWEYAARGGDGSNGYKYSGSNDINGVAWYRDNSGDKTHNVGTKDSNELGLHDMSGNVEEMTVSMRKTYGLPSSRSSNTVYRGGSWYSIESCSRVSSRQYITIMDGITGFRLIL